MHLALDVGGSFIRYEIVEAGTIGRVESSKISLETLLDSFINSFGIKKVGVAVAGWVRDGFVVFAPNIKLSHKNLAEYINKRWGVEAVVENDLNMAALAEAKYWGERDLVAIYSGTGLGAGVVLGGELIKGANSFAGEIGHISYKETPFKCSCGKSDCLELFASGSSLKRWAKHYNSDKYLLKELKDSRFKTIAKEYEEALLRAVSVMATLFNPSLIVLGGGVIEENRYLVDLVNMKLDEILPNHLSTKIEFTKLYDAPLEGIKMVLGVDEFIF